MRRFIKLLLISLTILLTIVYLLGCALPWLSPNYFWLLGFIGFSFPYIIVILIVVIIFWLFIKPKYALFLLLILCCGYQQLNAFFAFNTNTNFNKVKTINSIRIVSWNIGSLSGKTQEKNAIKHTSTEIINSILSQNADVICLQEMADLRNGLSLSKEFVAITKQYPYFYFPGWKIRVYYHRSGNVIFSKKPILSTDSAVFENGENIIKTDIIIDADTIDFYTTHFDSYRFSRNEFEEIDGEKLDEEQSKKNWKNIFSKVKHTLNIHNIEANVVNEFIKKSTHPFIFCADMNEVPNNYVYWKIRENKQDAFLQKGFGMGKTFNSLAAALRIDYMMPNNNFNVLQFNIIDNGCSDHAMLVADVELKK